MNSLKRETTIAKRKPDPFSFPATVCFRIFSSVSFSEAEPARSEAEGCFCGGISSLLKNSDSSAATKLFTFELRRSLLQKRRRAFLLVFGRATHAKQQCLKIKALSQSHLHAFVNRFHRILHGQRSVRD